MFIYALHSSAAPDIIRYIGQTQRDVRGRLAGHLASAKRGDRGYKADWIRKTIQDGHSVIASVLAVVSSSQEANELEKYYIAKLRADGVALTNQAEGGCDNRGWKHSEEWKQKRQIWGTAHFHSEETKRLLSEKNKGIGHPHTEEAKRKIGEAFCGKPKSAEQKEKLSLAVRGFTHTPEARAKIAEASRNRVISEETRRNCPRPSRGLSIQRKRG